MDIVIANGSYEAAYIIDMFNTRSNHLTIINDSEETARYLLEKKHVKVMRGSPSRLYVLDAADIYDADLFVALSPNDTDNYAACIMAKKIFNVKKCICLVRNPSNVELYKNLGIDSVISSTYTLASLVKNEANTEALFKSFAVDNENIAMIEVTLLSKYRICDQAIMDIGFPPYASIAYIVRDYSFLIPNGRVVLKPRDVLVIACAKENETQIMEYIRQEKSSRSYKKEANGLLSKKSETFPSSYEEHARDLLLSDEQKETKVKQVKSVNKKVEDIGSKKESSKKNKKKAEEAAENSQKQ